MFVCRWCFLKLYLFLLYIHLCILLVLIQPVVSYDPTAPVVALSSMGSENRPALYVAASTSYSKRGLHASDYQVPLLATRNLRTLQYEGSSTVLNMTEVAYEDETEVIYKHAFSYSGKVYFFAVRKNDRTRQYISVVSRVCEGDGSYKSHMEIEIQCRSGRVMYHKITAVTLGRVGNNLNKFFERDIVVISFNEHGSRNSAVCMYKMGDIENKFTDLFNDCRNGRSRARIGPLHIASGNCGGGVSTYHSLTTINITLSLYPYVCKL